MSAEAEYPEFDWWKGWEDLEQIQSPAAVFARPVGLGSLGRGSYFAEPYRIQSPHRVHIGAGVKFNERPVLSVLERADGTGGTLRIGDGCMIGSDFHVHAADEVEIGSHVGISARVAVGDVVSDLDPRNEDASIHIHDGAILGLGVIVLPGVTIGARAAIAAGAVVASDVPPRALVFGNPARPVGSWDEQTGEWMTGLRRR